MVATPTPKKPAGKPAPTTVSTKPGTVPAPAKPPHSVPPKGLSARALPPARPAVQSSVQPKARPAVQATQPVQPAAQPVASPVPNSLPLEQWAEQTLQAMRRETVEALQDIARTDIGHQPSADQLDAASQQEEREALVRRGERLKARLAEIQKAQKKLDDGEYGLCEISGEEIPRDRLQANPLARFTVEVQERLEIRQRQGLGA